MTTSNDAKTPLSIKSEDAVLKGKKKTAAPSGPSRKRFTYAIVATIALIALGSAFYAIKTTDQLRKATELQEHSLLTQMGALKLQQMDAQARFDSMSDSHVKLQSQLKTMDKDLQSALQQHLYQTNDWLLPKVRYYLELAQINDQWGHNTQTTLALLRQADTLLADIHDQRLFTIRETIAKEIVQLQDTPTRDLVGLLSQLDAAMDMIANVPIKPVITSLYKKNVTSDKNETISTWRDRIKQSVGLLEELVIIRHRDEDINPLPSPAYEAMLREEIRLNLQEAQWAVLQNNEALYQFLLTQAIKQINRSFAPDETQALLKQLQTLQQIHLIQPKPILEQSLPLLNQFIETKDKQGPAAAKGDNS